MGMTALARASTAVAPRPGATSTLTRELVRFAAAMALSSKLWFRTPMAINAEFMASRVLFFRVWISCSISSK